MSQYSALKEAIQTVIKQNGNKEITGQILQQALLSMITSLGAGYQFVGVAQPDTVPGTPDQNVMYIAAIPGSYPNFGLTVGNELAIFLYSGSWTKQSLDIWRQITRYGGNALQPYLDLMYDTYTMEMSGDDLVFSNTDHWFFLRISTGAGFYTLAPSSITIPGFASLSGFVLGIIYNPNSGSTDGIRFGYYTTGGDISEMAADECFEPIATIRKIDGVTTVVGGKLARPDKIGVVDYRKFQGGILQMFAGYLTESDITIQRANSDSVSITISTGQFFAKRTVQGASNWFYIANGSLSVPIGSMPSSCVLGVIYNPASSGTDAARYGYYTSEGYASEIADNEYFEPIALIQSMDEQKPIITGGQVYDILQQSKKHTSISKTIVYDQTFVSRENLGAINSNNVAISPETAISIVADGITLAQNVFIWPRVNSRLNKTVSRVIFNTSTSPGFKLVTYGLEDGSEGTMVEEIAELKFTANQIVTQELQGVAKTVNYTFAQNTDYRADIERTDKQVKLYITNLKTGVKTQITTYYGGTTGSGGLLYDVVGILNESATSAIIKRMTIESRVEKPVLVIYGDSITVGFYATMTDGINDKCFAYLVGEATHKNYLTSGRGGGAFNGLMGATDVKGYSYVGRLDSELPILLPRYAMVTIGTNGGGTYNQYKAVVEKILSYGITPILNTLPMRFTPGGGAAGVLPYIPTSNAAILQIWKDYNIHGARFDLATTLNNDGVTPDESLFNSDGVHPNDAGHQVLCDRVISDCPELFI